MGVHVFVNQGFEVEAREMFKDKKGDTDIRYLATNFIAHKDPRQ